MKIILLLVTLSFALPLAQRVAQLEKENELQQKYIDKLEKKHSGHERYISQDMDHKRSFHDSRKKDKYQGYLIDIIELIILAAGGGYLYKLKKGS